MDQPTRSSGLARVAVGLSCAALLLGAYAALRPSGPAATGGAAELAELRQELAALRTSVEQTRAQMSTPSGASALVEVEQRLSRVEATARAAALRPVASASSAGADGEAPETGEDERMRDGSPRYVALKAPSSAVAVEQLADGSLSVRNADPALAGTSMVIRGRTGDGVDRDVTITIPPPET